MTDKYIGNSRSEAVTRYEHTEITVLFLHFLNHIVEGICTVTYRKILAFCFFVKVAGAFSKAGMDTVFVCRKVYVVKKIFKIISASECYNDCVLGLSVIIYFL